MRPARPASSHCGKLFFKLSSPLKIEMAPPISVCNGDTFRGLREGTGPCVPASPTRSLRVRARDIGPCNMPRARSASLPAPRSYGTR